MPSASQDSPADSAAEPAAATADSASPPAFTIEFETDQGLRTLEKVESGEILRDVMLDADHKVPLYTAWGMVANCSGAGQCGTCAVQVRMLRLHGNFDVAPRCDRGS